MQLGWLAVEAFGLLRRYARYGKPAPVEKADAGRRFNFTERTPNLTEQVLLTLERLKATAARLAPNHPPPVPADLEGWLARLKTDPQALQGRLG